MALFLFFFCAVNRVIVLISIKVAAEEGFSVNY